MIDPVTPRINPMATRPLAVGAASTGPASKDALTPEHQKLRETAGQLEGLFVQQLFKAMRETVPTGDGIVSGGAGEDMFTGLMDQHLAADTPNQWGSGIAEALYRQMRGQTAPAPSVLPGSTIR